MLKMLKMFMNFGKGTKDNDNHVSSPSIEERRAEILTELGSQLGATRREKGLSLEAMAITTKIQRRLLQAIETGNLDELPEPIYTQSFIRQYADALGLNGAEFVSGFPLGSSRVAIQSSWRGLSTSQLRPTHLYVIYVFLIVFSVNGLSQILSRSELQTDNAKNPQNADNQPAASTQAQQPVAAKPVSATMEELSQPVRIGMTVKSQSWVRVVADGKTQFEGFLPRGTQRTWVAQEQLTVRTGNAGAVLVSYNQEKAQQMGVGEVQELTFGANIKS